MDHNRNWYLCDKADRCEVGSRIRQRLSHDAVVHGVGVHAAHYERVAIWLRFRNGRRTNCAVSTRTVFNDEWLSELCRKTIADYTRHHIGSATGRKWDDDRDSPCRIGLGCCRGHRCDQGQQRQGAKGMCTHGAYLECMLFTPGCPATNRSKSRRAGYLLYSNHCTVILHCQLTSAMLE